MAGSPSVRATGSIPSMRRLPHKAEGLTALVPVGVAALLIWLAQPTTQTQGLPVVGPVLAAALVGSALLVLVATRGRHMGWVGLLAAGGLVVALALLNAAAGICVGCQMYLLLKRFSGKGATA